MEKLYTLAIVDDESGQVNALANVIRQIAPMYKVLPFYRSADVLHYVASHTIDALLSDIRMPGMDGLALARKIHGLLPQVVVRIITAYSDFGYAQRAIEIGVCSYLIKPVSQQKLRDLMEQITQQIEERKATLQLAQESAKLRQFDHEQSLYAYLTRNTGPEQQDVLPQALTQSHCGIVAINRLSEDVHDWQALISMFIKQFAGHTLHMIRPVQSNRDLIILMPLQEREPLNKYASLFSLLSAQYQKPPIIRTGLAAWSETQTIRAAYQEAANILDYAFFLSPPLCLTKRDIAHCLPIPHAEIHLLENALQYAFRQQDSQSVSAVIAQFMNQCKDNHWAIPSWQAKEMINHILISVYQQLEEYGVQEIERQIIDAQSFQEAMTIFRDCLVRINAEHLQRLQETMEGLINRIINYVHDHYRDDLTLEQVAGLYHIGSSYLSSMFKQYAKCGFKEYIINARIQEAKRLLRQTDQKVYEISKELGYTDNTYFMKLFRREVGVSPSHYRSMERH